MTKHRPQAGLYTRGGEESVLVLVDFKKYQNKYRLLSMKSYRNSRLGPNAFLWDERRMSSPQSLAGEKLPLWANETSGGRVSWGPSLSMRPGFSPSPNSS